MKKLPNFLIIGAGKSGTTSLWHLLNEHPDIYMSPDKEPNFFNKDENYNKGLDWYQHLFRRAKNQKAIGEASNNYSCCGIFKNTVKRIKKTLPHVKIIYITRNPLKRAESEWMESRRIDSGKEKIPFNRSSGSLLCPCSTIGCTLHSKLDRCDFRSSYCLSLCHWNCGPLGRISATQCIG